MSNSTRIANVNAQFDKLTLLLTVISMCNDNYSLLYMIKSIN